MHRLVLLVLCAVATSGAMASSNVDNYSIPSFDATTGQVVAVTNNSITGLSLLFGPLSSSAPDFSHINASEGFLLLYQKVNIWRASSSSGAGSSPVPDHEASFNTSFSLSGTSPMAFVVLKDTYPPLLNPDGFRGPPNVTFAADAAASGDLADVEAGVVRAYDPFEPAVGLNVTVTPRGTATRRTVWVEYDAGVHRLSVFVAGDGEGTSSRPAEAIVDTTIRLAAGRRTTQNATVGFFAGAVRDVIVGVRDWNLTVERLDSRSSGSGEGRKKGALWVVMLLAVLGSVVVTF